MVRTVACIAGAMAILAGERPAVAAPPPVPKLIVALSIDQFAADLYQRYRPGFTGGLKRLGDGIAFTGYQSHAATETCPGHSTILTGHHPAATGIIANTWFDVKTGSSIYCVTVRGTADPDARGPQNLRVDTLGDWLKRAQPGARVVSVSGKDRAAIMLGGHTADAVYWWKDGVGFGTSPFAGPATPAVTAPAVRFDTALFARWRAAPPALWPTAIPATCAALQQPETFGTLALSGKVPPAAALGVEGPGFLAQSEFHDQLRASPVFDAVALDFAGDLVEANHLGRGPATDLLAVSLSTTDYVGHRYGNGGAEMCVQMAALDRALGTFLAKIDALGVPYVVMLTADHGGSDAAERAATHGVASARRIDPAALVKALNDHLRARFNLLYDPVPGDDPQQLSIVVADPAQHDPIRDAAVAWLKGRKEVAAVFTAAEMVAAVPPAGKPADQLTLAERFHESYDPERSGEIQVALAEHATIGMPHAPGDTVAGHGTPWDYDRRVPMLFWWPGVSPDARTEPVETVDIAPTLAAIAHIPAPKVDGHCLPAVAGTCP